MPAAAPAAAGDSCNPSCPRLRCQRKYPFGAAILIALSGWLPDSWSRRVSGRPNFDPPRALPLARRAITLTASEPTFLNTLDTILHRQNDSNPQVRLQPDIPCKGLLPEFPADSTSQPHQFHPLVPTTSVTATNTRGDCCVPEGPVSAALRDQVPILFNAGTAIGLSDRDLIERFLYEDREAADLAFKILVKRHGAMVLRVCNMGSAPPIYTSELIWVQFHGTWFPKKYHNEFYTGSHSDTYDLSFKCTSLNNPIPQSMFTVAGLDLKEGTPVMETRQGKRKITDIIKRPSTIKPQ